ncbi:MAG: diguanylate cyclase, partial [Gammaproteobacteria bacterium]
KLAEIDGVPVDAHIGHTLREVVPGVADTIEPLYRRVIETGKPVTSFEIHGTTPAQPGVERDWLVDYYPLKAPDGSVQAVGAIVVEITERKRAEEALFEEKERAQITLASIGDGVITIDAAGRVESFNPMAAQLLGWSHAEAQGLSLTEIFPIIDETTRERVEDPVQSCLRLGKTTGFGRPVVLPRRDGKELVIDDSAAPIHDRDGRVVGAVMTFRDVTAQHRLAEQLTYQATHDGLTGLVNRQEFERRLGLMLKHAKEQHLRHVLCYLDLDQFKVVNDTCGHSAGDELLRQLSALLKTRMRERDTLARLGGDEFAVLLGECPLDQAVRIANQLRELVQDLRFIWEDRSFSVGVSIGLVPITETAGDLSSLMSAADSACFAAKERGRNCVYVYRPGDTDLQQRQEEMHWLTRLHQTLVHDRLCLYYQPIVPLGQSTTGGTRGEILLRLIDEQGRVLLPGAFILAAERYNQMLAIDRWVVRSTLAALSNASPVSAPTHYGINVSGQSLSNTEFLY